MTIMRQSAQSGCIEIVIDAEYVPATGVTFRSFLSHVTCVFATTCTSSQRPPPSLTETRTYPFFIFLVEYRSLARVDSCSSCTEGHRPICSRQRSSHYLMQKSSPLSLEHHCLRYFHKRWKKTEAALSRKCQLLHNLYQNP